MSTAAKPAVRPDRAHFSSGPCAKRPGWSPENLKLESLGRSHRSKLGKSRLKLAIDKTRSVLKIPADYRIGIMPGSDTGAIEAAFWSMHDAVFEHQAELSADTLTALATAAGARADLVRAAMAKHKYAPAIEADADLADDVHADGTPHFFVNGRRLEGAVPEEKFAALIDQELTIKRIGEAAAANAGAEAAALSLGDRVQRGRRVLRHGAAPRDGEAEARDQRLAAVQLHALHPLATLLW